MRPCLLTVCGGALLLAALTAAPTGATAPRPNIIHIFADDLGYGSVGFNGQADIKTPNLDALAAAGMKLNNAYAAPVCAPSRAMLLTGFHQGHASIDGNNGLSTGFRAQDVMTPQVIGPTGYTSAIIGKWGWGATGARNLTGSDAVPTINLPNSLPGNHGFSTFYGYLNHGAAQDYYYDHMWRNQTGAANGVAIVANNGGPGGTPQYTHDLFATQSEQFVAAHAGDANPFYLQVSYTIPHYDIDQIATAPGGFGTYASKPWTNSQKAYAAMITRMDATIGTLMARLDDPNNDGNTADSIRNNTLVIFTSDNGPSPTEDNVPADFFNANGPFRGGKFEVYEGGIHMPAVAYWPGTIAPGSVSNYRTDLADFMATAAELAGAEAPVGIDGTSLVPTLTGQGHQRQRDYLVFEHQGAKGGDPDQRVARYAVIRQDGMKLIHYDSSPTEDLYDVVADPDENVPLPTNTQIANELRSAAVAEGVFRGVVEYRKYTGPSGGNVQAAASWDGLGRPHGDWSATITNMTGSPRIAHVSDNVTTLGVEVRGTSALQVVDVHAGSTLSGRNEVRVGNHGRVDLSGGTLATNRWVNVRAGGEVRGTGTITGDVYNEGTVSPGRPNEATSWPIVAPPALPSALMDTGVVNAVAFNFTGVQDDVPLLATSTLNSNIEVTRGLDFGPGLRPRLGNGGTDKGNEFNLCGHDTNSLASAIGAGDYVSFTVDPIDGAGMFPSSVSFRVWRNGNSSAKDFAILSSADNFTAALTPPTTYTDVGDPNTQAGFHTLTAAIPAATATTGPIEYRLYAWNATAAAGNTHFVAASLNARFIGVQTLEFNLAGAQAGAPITALKRQDARMTLTSGLTAGMGLSPIASTDELQLAGFSTGANQSDAIAGDQYLSFSVQPVQGMAMFADSVNFSLWRDSGDSATNYAVFSSLGGFAAGQELAQTQSAAIGAGSPISLTGSFPGSQPTTGPVEFRLYGWNAASPAASTHITGAAMRARFASIAGSPIDPTGSLAVQGDFYHLEGGILAIDIGGNTAGTNYDALNVQGKVVLEGDLAVLLADADGSPFAPALHDTFSILTATQGVTGEFDAVTLPQLSWALDWRVDYLSTSVVLAVIATGDFNRNGVVDAADYAVWRDNGGTQELYDIWRANFGNTVASSSLVSGSSAGLVPEPTTMLLLAIVALAAVWKRSSRRA